MYAYDGDGKRVRKVGGSLYWTGAGSDALAETDQTGTMQSEYVFFNGTRIARLDANLTAKYYFGDHLGSTTLITDASGTRLAESQYFPYGGERALLSNDNNHYKFTGKEEDSVTGLDYFGARHYGNVAGRFLSPDPLLNSGHPGEPQSWNRYAYVLNNPLTTLDPTGLYNVVSHCTDDQANYKHCVQVENQAAENLRTGLQKLKEKVDRMKDGPEKDRLQASLDALGTENDENNVYVSFVPPADGGSGETDVVTNPITNETNYNVALDPSRIGNLNIMAIDAAHEGTHVSDFERMISNKAPSPLSDFSLEYRGYQTSVWAASALGLSSFSLTYDKKTSVIWNGSWKEVDKNITNIVTSFHDKNGTPTHPETTPHNPWPN